MKKYWAICFALLVLTTTFPVGKLIAAETLTVFSAASLAPLMDDMVPEFEAEYKVAIRLSLASSSILAKQIVHGSPANVFISANKLWVDNLVENKIVEKQNVYPIVRNTLVIVSHISLPNIIGAFTPRKTSPGSKFIVGDPSHVPVGIYAKQALEALGFWNDLKDRIIPAENARVALAWLERDNSLWGVVYLSDLSLTDTLKEQWIIPEMLHRPVVYYMALITNSKNTQNLLKFFRSERFHKLILKHGFRTY